MFVDSQDVMWQAWCNDWCIQQITGHVGTGDLLDTQTMNLEEIL